MPRSVPLLVFPALVSGAIAAVFSLAHAESFGPPSEGRLARLLATSPYEGERMAAVKELVARGVGAQALQEATGDRCVRVRLEAAIELARRLDSTSIEPLLSGVSEGDADTRKRVALALNLLDDRRAREKIKEMAEKDPDPGVRKLARSLVPR